MVVVGGGGEEGAWESFGWKDDEKEIEPLLIEEVDMQLWAVISCISIMCIFDPSASIDSHMAVLLLYVVNVSSVVDPIILISLGWNFFPLHYGSEKLPFFQGDGGR